MPQDSLFARDEDDPARFAHYHLERRPDGSAWTLGQGAMGITYKAWDEKLRVPVALKVIAPRLIENPRAQALFLREARAAARVRHTHVASVLALSDTPGNFYYAMEFVDGMPLDAWLRERGTLAPLLALDLASQIAQGLGAIHAQGIVHRDLKPANVMLLPAGSTPGLGEAWTAKIIDFGLARFLAPGATAAGETADPSRGFQGTALYASPEQCLERRDLDGRSDLYSLGCILWEMLTGAPIFAAKSHWDMLNAHVTAPPPWERVAHLPAAVREILTRLLPKHRDERFPDAATAIRALEAARRQSEAGSAFEDAAQTTLLPPAPVPPAVRPPTPTPTDAAPVAAPRRRRWYLEYALILLVAGGLAWWVSKRMADVPKTIIPTPGLPERSLAVLPFENATTEKSDDFFAEGLQDDVLASLSKIKELVVVSRSSVLPFRGVNGAEKLREAGRLLGVANVLEGRVRRSGNRVVLNVALTDVRTSQQLWAERYDRTLADSLTLQGELAQEIARALRATLSPEENARVSVKPTENPDAYVLYLRARDIETRPHLSSASHEEAIRLYADAIALDPAFAVARARLASALTFLYVNGQPTPAIRARAFAEVTEALRLQPRLGEAHLARALFTYRVHSDYAEALRELGEVALLLPADPEVDLVAGYIQRRQGRWRECRATIERAFARDPRSPAAAQVLLEVTTALHDWPAAAAAGDRAVALAPDSASLRVTRAGVEFWMRQDPAPMRAMLATLPASAAGDGNITLARWDAAMLARDFPAAEKLLADEAAAPPLTAYNLELPRAYLRGCLALARGEPAAAKIQFEAALPTFEAAVRERPQEFSRHGQLGLLYAYLGRREDDIREGRRGVELKPESQDALDAPSAAGILALILARCGEADEALTIITRLLTVPSAENLTFEASLTLADLRCRWQWDPLRADPRFQALLAAPEPKTIY